jgi:hypothetical protein
MWRSRSRMQAGTRGLSGSGDHPSLAFDTRELIAKHWLRWQFCSSGWDHVEGGATKNACAAPSRAGIILFPFPRFQCPPRGSRGGRLHHGLTPRDAPPALGVGGTRILEDLECICFVPDREQGGEDGAAAGRGQRHGRGREIQAGITSREALRNRCVAPQPRSLRTYSSSSRALIRGLRHMHVPPLKAALQ